MGVYFAADVGSISNAIQAVDIMGVNFAASVVSDIKFNSSSGYYGGTLCCYSRVSYQIQFKQGILWG